MKILANPLTDLKKPWVFIKFIHTDNKPHTFHSEVNSLTGSRLTAFDNDAPSINESVAWVKSVIKDIRNKRTVLEFQGNLKFEDES